MSTPGGGVEEFRQPPNLPISGQVPGKAVPGTPAPPGGRAEPSSIASAIASNDGSAIDQAMIRSFNRGIAPAKPLDTNERGVMTLVDSDHRQPGQPRSPRNGEQSLLAARCLAPSASLASRHHSRKRAIFQQYDALARGANDQVRVDTATVIDVLRKEADNKSLRIAMPDVVSHAKLIADNLEAEGGSLSPLEAQDLIKTLNHSLIGFWSQPNGASKQAVIAPGVAELNAQLDKAVTGAVGGQYAGLRAQYSAIRSVEDDITKAVNRELRKNPETAKRLIAADGGLNIAHLILGGMHGNPIAAGGLLTKGLRETQKYLKDPNRAIARMFINRDRTRSGYTPPASTSRLLPTIGGVMGGDAASRRPGMSYSVGP